MFITGYWRTPLHWYNNFCIGSNSANHGILPPTSWWIQVRLFCFMTSFHNFGAHEQLAYINYIRLVRVVIYCYSHILSVPNNAQTLETIINNELKLKTFMEKTDVDSNLCNLLFSRRIIFNWAHRTVGLSALILAGQFDLLTFFPLLYTKFKGFLVFLPKLHDQFPSLNPLCRYRGRLSFQKSKIFIIFKEKYSKFFIIFFLFHSFYFISCYPVLGCLH